jgi:protocatechuate 3,4-dioxygenase beta subunit
VQLGDYLVRVQVDGIDGPLQVDEVKGSPTLGRYISPKVSITSPQKVILRSTNIDLDVESRTEETVTVKGEVTVWDQNDHPVRNADVAIEWETPDGSNPTDTKKTDGNGIAEFTTTGANGIYILEVKNIAISGAHEFDRDPNHSVLRSEPLDTTLPSLRSTNIALPFTEDGDNITVNGAVTVEDENGDPVEDANVSITWTRPDGTSTSPSAPTNALGIANFSVSNGRGTYTLRVDTIAKAGYNFNRSDSHSDDLEKSISIPIIRKRLRSTDIVFSFTEADNGVTLTGEVTVTDENGSPVEGANVAATWTLPDGSSTNRSGNTGADGVARLQIVNGRGVYRLRVNTLSKSGYEFNPAESPVREKSISIFAGDKLISKILELSGIERENEILEARARVFVRDENDIPIMDAAVRVRWTFNGVSEEHETISKTDGIAWFTLKKGDGVYRAKVINIEKGDYEFEPDEGVTEKEYRLPNLRMRSGSINTAARPETDGTFTVSSSTTVTAEAVTPEVRDAIVIARWVLPAPLPERWQQKLTDARGRIAFEINDGPGHYTFFISDIFKDGYTFAVSGSGLRDDIDVP